MGDRPTSLHQFPLTFVATIAAMDDFFIPDSIENGPVGVLCARCNSWIPAAEYEQHRDECTED